MKIRSCSMFGIGFSLLLPACSATNEVEQVSVQSAALTGEDVTPTSLSAVTDYRGTPARTNGLDKVFDNDTSTKLLVGKTEEWIQYRMVRPTIVTSYGITSANDSVEADPKNWTLEGSFDGVGWVELDRRTDEVFTERFQTNSYTVANNAAYLFYRLNVSDNFGDESSDLQLSEFRVGGSMSAGTVPGTPTIRSMGVSGNAVTVTWTATANATGYYVQRIADDGKSTIEFLTNATSYTDSKLAPGVTYLYQVQAVNGTLRGFPSARGSRVTTAALPTPAKDVTALSAYAPVDQYATSGVEGVEKVTDNGAYTKYYTGNSTTSISLRTTPGAVVTQYTLTSANDYPERDPKNWTLEGSMNGTDWVPLDTQTNQGFASRFQTRVFACNPSGSAYDYYQLTITSNHGSGSTQLAEWRLLGTVNGNLVTPAAPSNVVATAVTSDQLKLTWSDNAGQLNPEDAYVVERATDSAFTENLVASTLGANNTEYRASSLAPGQTYYFRVRATNAAGSTGFVGPVQATTHTLSAPPASWLETGWYGGHNRTVYRTYLDSDVAVYFDEYVPNRESITWISPIFSEAWAYTKSVYGSFSDPILYVIGNQDDVPTDYNDAYGGGGIQDVYNPSANYRNVIFSASNNWPVGPAFTTTDPGWNFGSLIHELSHIVEGNNNGFAGSPSYGVWQDSKWAEIFVYDVKRHLTSIPGEKAAQDDYNRYMNEVDDYGRHWFRDWYYPLYNGDFGNKAEANKGTAFLVKYFQLLSQYLPKTNGAYEPRGLNYGEYIHFCAGAAGVDLEDEAKTAFVFSPEVELQLARAQQEFPAVYALYNGTAGSTGPCDTLCTSPTKFASQSYSSGNLSSATTCHETTASLQGLVCGNFAAGRTFRINDTLVTCNGSPITLPAKRNGGYCLQASAGDYAWAYFQTF